MYTGLNPKTKPQKGAQVQEISMRNAILSDSGQIINDRSRETTPLFPVLIRPAQLNREMAGK